MAVLLRRFNTVPRMLTKCPARACAGGDALEALSLLLKEDKGVKAAWEIIEVRDSLWDHSGR